MRILIVSHAYAERANHIKLETLSAIPDLQIAVIYPRRWRTWHGEDKKVQKSIRQLADKNQNLYQEITLDTFFTGDGGKYIYNPIQLIESALRFKPDVIYVEEEPFSFVSCQLSVVSFLLKKKFAFFTWENLDLPLGKLRSIAEKISFKASFRAVAGSLGAVERLEKRGFIRPTAVLPQFGVNTAVFQKDPLAKDVSSGLVIGFVGRPSTAKGIDVLMKAASILPFEYRLLIVTSSKGVPQEFLDLAYSLNISDKVLYKTSVPHADLPKYFNQMDVFVLPSRTTITWKEQFGRTLLEAMACGVPVIGSSSGAIPEVIGTAGLVFKEEDSSDLCNKLTLLNSEKARKRFSEAGSKRVLENFTYQILCNNLINFLNS